jgi:hypothetical protein
MTISLYVRDLLFCERLLSAARAAGHQATLLAGGSPAAGPAPDLLVVDLREAGWEEAVAWARSLPTRTRILAFGPHVRADLFEAARAAGVDRAVSNSKVHGDPAGLMEAVARG